MKITVSIPDHAVSAAGALGVGRDILHATTMANSWTVAGTKK
jgi:hypothetical protein